MRIIRSPWFALFVLTFTFTLGFIDRQILNLLVQPIKNDFLLSDIEIAMLQGSAFSIAYLVMSPLFGRWADVYRRRNILLACIVAWSSFTALCSIASGFSSLFAIRSVVGGAEAGLTPMAWSLLSDYFDDRRLGRAMGIYTTGTFLGSGLALVLGGAVLKAVEGVGLHALPVIGRIHPWQVTFLVVGSLGIVAAALVLLLREPPRRSTTVKASAASVGLGDTLRYICRERRFYFLFYLGIAFTVVPIAAFSSWLPTLVLRQYHVPLAIVGMQYGLAAMAGGTFGVLVSPIIAAALERRGMQDANVRCCIFTNIGMLFCCGALLLRSNYGQVLAIGGAVSVFCSMPMPIAATALQVSTPNRMRGLVTAIYIVIMTITGLCLSPVAIAFLTDKVFRDETRVGDSVAIVCGVTSAVAALLLVPCLRSYRELTAATRAEAA